MSNLNNDYETLQICTVYSVLEELNKTPDTTRSEIFQMLAEDYATLNLHLLFNPRVLQRVWDRVFQSSAYRDFVLDVSVRLKTQLELRDESTQGNLTERLRTKIAKSFSSVAFGPSVTEPIPEDEQIAAIMYNSLHIPFSKVELVLNENFWLFTYIAIIYYFDNIVGEITPVKQNKEN